MRTVRQMASGVVYAIVSLLLVLGSVALASAQRGRPLAMQESATPSAAPARTRAVITATTRPSITPALTTTSVPALSTVIPSATPAFPTAKPTVRPTSSYAGTCGPYAGWVQGYEVQAGDNLFRIALLHGVSVEALQRANCRLGTVIYPGEWLWVPFVLPPPTELTIIPTFDTPTEPASPTASPTPSDAPPTEETPDP